MDDANDLSFQVSVKGMFFDSSGKLMLIKEPSGFWELPGGRIRKGEDFKSCLIRECQEELGLSCEVVEDQPKFVWPAIDLEGRGRLMVCFEVNFASLDFVASEECVEVKFFDASEIAGLKIYPQLKPIINLLSE